MKCKGFTMVELLVVIAIIAILAAIIFPVFARAREKARQATCLTSLKVLGRALALYENEGIYFPRADVEKRLYSPGAMLCPEAQTNPEGRSYLWNGYLRGRTIECIRDRGSVIAALDGSSENGEFFESVEDGVDLARHNDGANVLFLDRHAKWLCRGDLLRDNAYFDKAKYLIVPGIARVKPVVAGTYRVEGNPDWSVVVDKDGNTRLVPRE